MGLSSFEVARKTTCQLTIGICRCVSSCSDDGLCEHIELGRCCPVRLTLAARELFSVDSHSIYE